MNAVRMIRVRAICRKGLSNVGMFAVLPVAACVPVLATSLVGGLFGSPGESGPLTYTATRGEFLYEITADGTLESSRSVEVQCEVSPLSGFYGYHGTMILEIVPEGTYVQPGDVLVRLDSSAWEDYLNYRQRLWRRGRATVIRDEQRLEAATVALEVYRKGTFGLEQRTLECDVVEAQSKYDQARRYYKNSKALQKRGYITRSQLKADRIAMQDAKRELTLAKVKLSILEDFSREKTIKRLENDVLDAEGRVRSRRATQEHYAWHLTRAKDQIAKCTIRAPVAGQVVYAKEDDEGEQLAIEEGALVRKLQTILYLPDLNQMQVNATIEEKFITKVLPGMTAKVTLDARPHLELSGVVERVEYYPKPMYWRLAQIKQYETIIRLDDPPPGLRPGLSAKAEICIERAEDKLQVPAVAVLHLDGSHYCVVRRGRSWEARPVRIGSHNETHVVIEENIEPGEEIVLNASSYRDQVDLPESESPPVADAATVAQW